MALPSINATCDIYRSSISPPASPSVAGVSFYLAEEAAKGCAAASGSTTTLWTHIGLFELTVDVRHDATLPWTAGDSIYVPDQNGTRFDVILVVRVGRGSVSSHKKAFLRLRTVPWPTQDL